MVSIDIMNSQVNVRMPKELLELTKKHAKKRGYSTMQEFIKEAIREKIFEERTVSKKELKLVEELLKVSKEKNLFGTQKELLKKLSE